MKKGLIWLLLYLPVHQELKQQKIYPINVRTEMLAANSAIIRATELGFGGIPGPSPSGCPICSPAGVPATFFSNLLCSTLV